MAIHYIRRTLPAATPKKESRLYSRRAWQRQSAAFVQAYPLCVWCYVNGRLNQGSIEHPSDRQRTLIVDHIRPHRGNEVLFWDQRNWQTLCATPCHDKVKQAAEKTGQDWWELCKQAMKESRARDIGALPEHVQAGLTAIMAGGRVEC